MKLYGGDGLEATLRGEKESGQSAAEEEDAPAPTLLCFLEGAPLLLHVTAPPACVSLWSLRTCQLAASALWPCHDALSALAPLRGSPYALLADSRACLRAARLALGCVEPREWSWTLLGAHEDASFASNDSSAPVVALAQQPGAPDGGRLLAVTSCGCATLLDLPSKRAVSSFRAGAGCTAAAWLNDSLLATTHADGACKLWTLPEDALPHRAAPGKPCGATLVVAWPFHGAVTELAFHPSPPRTAAAGGTLFLLVQGETWAMPVLTTSGIALLEPQRLHAGSDAVRLIRVAGSTADARGAIVRLIACSDQHPLVSMLYAVGQPHEARWRSHTLSVHAADCTALRALCLDAGPLLRHLLAAREGGDCAGLLHSATPSAPHRLLATSSESNVELWDASGAALAPLARIPCCQAACFDVCPTCALCLCLCRDGRACLHALDVAGCSLVSEAQIGDIDGGGGGFNDVVLASALRLAAACDSSGAVTLLHLPDLRVIGKASPLPRGEAAHSARFCSSEDGAPLLLLLLLGDCGSLAALRCDASGMTCAGTLVTSPDRSPQSNALLLSALDAGGAPVAPMQRAMVGHPRAPLPREARGSEDKGDDDDDSAVAALQLPAATLLLVTADAAALMPLSQLLRGVSSGVRRRCFDVAASNAATFTATGGAALCVLDRSLALHILSASSLAPIHRVDFPGLLYDGWAGQVPLLWHLAPDGHLFTVWTDAAKQPIPELLRLEMLDEFCAAFTPPEMPPPGLWDRSRAEADTASSEAEDASDVPSPAPPPHSTDTRGGLNPLAARLREGVARMADKGKAALAQSGLIPRRKVLSPADMECLFPPMASAPLPTLVVGPAVGPAVVNPGRDRTELLGAGSPATLRTPDEVRARYGRAPRARGADDVAEGMNENVQKMHERGEKLSNIQEKTQRMEHEAQQFAANAKKLADSQRLFSW